MDELDLRILISDPLRFPTPERRFFDWMNFVEPAKAIRVIVWGDADKRARALAEAAAQCDGIVHSCDRYRTRLQFLLALASAAGHRGRESRFETSEWLKLYLCKPHRSLFLDNVDRLTVSQFRSLRDFHDAGARLVLAGASAKIARMVNDSDEGGCMKTRCLLKTVDETPLEFSVPKPRRRRDVVARVSRGSREND